MIHWYWIPVILSVGVCIGILVAGLLWSARGDDDGFQG